MINKFTHLQSALPASSQRRRPFLHWAKSDLHKAYSSRIKKLTACIIIMKLLQHSLNQILQHNFACYPLPLSLMILITYLYIKILHKDEELNSQLGIRFNKFANLRHDCNCKSRNYKFIELVLYHNPWLCLAVSLWIG